MTIIREAIDRAQLAEMAQDFYGEMIKGIVDVEDKAVREKISLIVNDLVR